jgi:D-sedoheptulose 7-phosphate isomerase
VNIPEFSKNYIGELCGLLDRFDMERFQQLVEKLLDAYHDAHGIFVMGNGGSAATASHFACDINKGCCLDLKKKFRVICLNDSLPTIMALANDLDYAAVFVEQLKNFFVPGDLVIGISGSGNSPNVLNAIQYARENRGYTIGLTGYSGGRLSHMVDLAIVTPSDDMQKIEDMHMILVHMTMQAVYGHLHEKSGTSGC